MHNVDDHTTPSTDTSTDTTKKHRLSKIARCWDNEIRSMLGRFAQYLWPDVRLLGLVPIHSYRIRKRLESGTVVWWVERDIPPFDHYLCEAYTVELSLVDPDRPRLDVYTGTSAYPVAPMSVNGLKTTLARAVADTPLVIHRQFEPALDP